MEITSRMELITVMIPTYRSPPYICRVELQMICTAQLVMDIVKPVVPSAVMLQTRFHFSRKHFNCRRRMAFFPVRKRRTHKAERN